MSDSVRPHRRRPIRLCRPWDSPGKNTGVGCHFLLQCMKVKSESEVAQSTRGILTSLHLLLLIIFLKFFFRYCTYTNMFWFHSRDIIYKVYKLTKIYKHALDKLILEGCCINKHVAMWFLKNNLIWISLHCLDFPC